MQPTFDGAVFKNRVETATTSIRGVKQADMDINREKILKVLICNATLAGLCDSRVLAPEQPDRHVRPRQETLDLIR